MKKTLLFLTIASLLFSCSSDNNNSSNNNNNNGNSFSNSMDYEFTITINGEVHKVKGNTTNGIPTGTVIPSINNINNQCTIGDNSGQKNISLGINDVTASNFISGQSLQCYIFLSNLLLGVNQAQVMFYGTYFDTFATNLGGAASGTGLLKYQTIIGPANNNIQFKLPIFDYRKKKFFNP